MDENFIRISEKKPMDFEEDLFQHLIRFLNSVNGGMFLTVLKQ